MATTIGFMVAIVVNYSLQYHWTFASGQDHRVVFRRYVTVTVITALLNTGFFTVLVYWAGIDYLVAQIVSTGFIFMINFQLNKRYCFAPARTY